MAMVKFNWLKLKALLGFHTSPLIQLTAFEILLEYAHAHIKLFLITAMAAMCKVPVQYQNEN